MSYQDPFVAIWPGVPTAGARLRHIPEVVQGAAAHFIAWDGVASLGRLGSPADVPPIEPSHPFVPWLTIGLSMLIAGHDLARGRLPTVWINVTDRLLAPVFLVLGRLHNGLVGDYVAWIVVGLALVSLSFVAAGI